MLSADDKARVKWACRRGMLELDVIIMPFLKSVSMVYRSKNSKTLLHYLVVMIQISLSGL